MEKEYYLRQNFIANYAILQYKTCQNRQKFCLIFYTSFAKLPNVLVGINIHSVQPRKY